MEAMALIEIDVFYHQTQVVFDGLDKIIGKMMINPLVN
jgi:hypothetical protein